MWQPWANTNNIAWLLQKMNCSHTSQAQRWSNPVFCVTSIPFFTSMTEVGLLCHWDSNNWNRHGQWTMSGCQGLNYSAWLRPSLLEANEVKYHVLFLFSCRKILLNENAELHCLSIGTSEAIPLLIIKIWKGILGSLVSLVRWWNMLKSILKYPSISLGLVFSVHISI